MLFYFLDFIRVKQSFVAYNCHIYTETDSAGEQSVRDVLMKNKNNKIKEIRYSFILLLIITIFRLLICLTIES